MGIIQEELNKVRQHWNQHRIRPTHNCEAPNGKPDVLYFLPHLTGIHFQFMAN